MRIVKSVRICEDVDVAIELSMEDVCSVYYEEPTSFNSMLCQINRTGAFLKTLPSKFIADLNDAQRETIIKFFEDFIRTLNMPIPEEKEKK